MVIKQFDEQFETKITALYEQVCAKKEAIQELTADYFSEEKDLHSFIQEYESYFAQLEARRADFLRQKQSLEHALQKAHQSDAERTFWDAWENKPKAPDSQPEQEEDTVDFYDFDDANVPLEAESLEIDAEALFANKPSSDSETVIREEVASKPKIRDAKKVVAEAFRWIYHPRVRNDPPTPFEILAEKRARTINELVDNAQFDEVDFMMRIPFEDEDKALWGQPLFKGAGESLGDRYYRLQQWDWLLDLAMKRAEALAASEPHALYQTFLEWKKRNVKMITFLQEVEKVKEQELQAIRAAIAKLQLQLEEAKS